MIAVDTSIAIAALSPWHDRHADAADTCRGGAPIPAHALLEAYTTLIRMPEPLRISGQVAAELNFDFTPVRAIQVSLAYMVFPPEKFAACPPKADMGDSTSLE